MSTGLRVLICAVVAIVTAAVVSAVQHYAGFMEDSAYLVGGAGGIAAVMAWQLTGRKKS
jgi:hypothetical protein